MTSYRVANIGPLYNIYCKIRQSSVIIKQSTGDKLMDPPLLMKNTSFMHIYYCFEKSLTLLVCTTQSWVYIKPLL